MHAYQWLSHSHQISSIWFMVIVVISGYHMLSRGYQWLLRGYQWLLHGYQCFITCYQWIISSYCTVIRLVQSGFMVIVVVSGYRMAISVLSHVISGLSAVIAWLSD